MNSRAEKAESSFRSLLQEDLSSNSGNFQQDSGVAASSQEHWRQKLYSGGGAPSENEYKQINRGFSLDQPQFSSQASSNDSAMTSQNLTAAFQVDSATAYGLLLSENHQQQQHPSYQNRTLLNYPYPSPSSGYGAELIPSLNKYPQFLRTSPPKQPPQPAADGGNHLHFTNNTPFWNASAPPAAMTDARSSFFPALQTQIPAAPSFDEKPKVIENLNIILWMHDSTCNSQLITILGFLKIHFFFFIFLFGVLLMHHGNKFFPLRCKLYKSLPLFFFFSSRTSPRFGIWVQQRRKTIRKHRIKDPGTKRLHHCQLLRYAY